MFKGLLDFRAIRFPGLISISTIPSGGTSDYLPAMLHAANNNTPYTCFVNKASQLPFMVMPGIPYPWALEATLSLAIWCLSGTEIANPLFSQKKMIGNLCIEAKFIPSWQSPELEAPSPK